MARRVSAPQWWANRKQARQAAQIPVLDLRNSEMVAPPQWPTADVLDMEEEAQLAAGVRDIPLDFQTRTLFPDRPRTVAAGYDPASQTLRIKFRPGADMKSPGGAVYDYHEVSEKEWWAVQHTISTGRFINNQLAGKDYNRIG
jgi:hypothetical protein